MYTQLINVSIDITKIKEEVAFQGKNGAKYINVSVFVNNKADDYGNDVAVKQSYKNESGTWSDHYIGNGKTRQASQGQTSTGTVIK